MESETLEKTSFLDPDVYLDPLNVIIMQSDSRLRV